MDTFHIGQSRESTNTVKLINGTNHPLMKNTKPLYPHYLSVMTTQLLIVYIEHPDNYDEQHVQYAPYKLLISQLEEKNTICATYGSTSPCNPDTIEITSEIDHLSTRDTRSTVTVSERLSISLHLIAIESDDADIITDDDDV